MSTTMLVLKKNEHFPTGLIPILKAKELMLCSVAFAAGDGVQTLAIPANKIDWAMAIKKIQEKYPEAVKTFHFGTECENEKDQQPFPVLHEGEEISLAVMLEGEFPNFQRDNGLSNEYNVFNEYLDGKIKQEFANCGEDLDKLMERIDSPTFRMELAGFLEPRAAIYIISKNNKVLVMMKNMVSARTFSWGSITNNHGFGEEKKEVVPKIPPKTEKKAKLDLSDLMEEEKKESELVPMNPKTDTKIPDKAGEETFSCPDEYKGAARKHWETRNLLDKYHRMPGWETTGEKRLKFTRAMLKSDSPLLGKAKDFKEMAKGLEDKKEKEEKKAHGIISGVTHEMSPKSKEAIVNLIHEKHLIVSAEQFEELEREFDKFTDQLNISEDLPLFWGLAGYLHLASKTQHGAALLLNQFARRILELDKTLAPKMLEKVTTPDNKDKKSKLNLDDLMESAKAVKH